MNAWERGFEAGEKACHEDKKAGRPRKFRPEHVKDAFQEGWWAGYSPRSLTWALRGDPRPWWADRTERAEESHA